MENEDNPNANSEIRYITLELMKLAQKRRIPFKKQAKEFVENTYAMAEMLHSARESEGAFEKGRSRQYRGGQEK